MSNDYFADLREGAIVERTLSYRGRERKVHFRPLTAGERVQLLQGQTLSIGDDGKPKRPDLDLAYLTSRRQLLVQFMLVRPDGTNVYADLASVQSEPEDLVDALYALAAEAFSGDDAGNA